MTMAEKEKKRVNLVHQQQIMTETIKKELRHQKFHTNFAVNPFKKGYAITGKLNSMHDAAEEGGKPDELVMKIIQHAQKLPTEKYSAPVTTSQDYGWMSEPLVESDRFDIRLNHPKRLTDVTKTQEAMWALEKNHCVMSRK